MEGRRFERDPQGGRLLTPAFEMRWVNVAEILKSVKNDYDQMGMGDRWRLDFFRERPHVLASLAVQEKFHRGTYLHTLRMVHLGFGLVNSEQGASVELEPQEKDTFLVALACHDVGKADEKKRFFVSKDKGKEKSVSVSELILKPRRLNKEEVGVTKLHPIIGANWLINIANNGIARSMETRKAAAMVALHHGWQCFSPYNSSYPIEMADVLIEKFREEQVDNPLLTSREIEKIIKSDCSFDNMGGLTLNDLRASLLVAMIDHCDAISALRHYREEDVRLAKEAEMADVKYQERKKDVFNELVDVFVNEPFFNILSEEQIYNVIFFLKSRYDWIYNSSKINFRSLT